MSVLRISSDAPPPPRPRKVTFEEYFAAEQKAETRSEYIDGVVRAMPGGGSDHLLVSSVLGEILGSRLRSLGSCRFLDQNVQIPIPAFNIYTYPDAAIACPPQFVAKARGALVNPKVIFEVLSPSTEAYDRGPKFRRYRSLETLQEYVLISVEEPLVEVFARPSWGVQTYVGLDAIARLGSVGLDLPLRELYVDVSFDEGA